jgi:tetratricopeptide (TPR) repeat protein
VPADRRLRVHNGDDFAAAPNALQDDPDRSLAALVQGLPRRPRGRRRKPQQALGFSQSADLCKQALAVAREAGDRVTQANALMHLSAIYGNEGRVEPSLDIGEQALALYRELGDRAGEAVQLANQGLSYFGKGQWREGIEYLQQALALGRETGDRFTIAEALVYLGDSYRLLDRYQEAEDHARECLGVVARQSGLSNFEADALIVLAAICHRQGRYALAAGYCQRALAICEALGYRMYQAAALDIFGQTLLATGQPDQARACHTAALDLARESGFAEGQAFSLMGLGEVSRWHGDHGEAYGYYQQALVVLCYVPARAAASRSRVNGWQHSGQAPRMRASTICSSCRT